jgi:hypothetical protein
LRVIVGWYLLLKFTFAVRTADFSSCESAVLTIPDEKNASEYSFKKHLSLEFLFKHHNAKSTMATLQRLQAGLGLCSPAPTRNRQHEKQDTTMQKACVGNGSPAGNT